VHRIVLDNRRAVGIRYSVAGQAREARANREVLLCAGAVQSPQLLELSGIGNPELLRKYDIDVAHELPGVGENYRDHYASSIAWRVKGVTTLNQDTRPLKLLGEAAKYAFTRRGVMTYTAGIAHGFVRTREELDSPDVQFHFAHASYARNARRGTLEREPGMTLSVCQLRPESQGSIHIQSNDPEAAPAIRPNFLSEQIDRDALVAGMRIARQVGAAPALQKFSDNELFPGATCDSYEELLNFCRATGSTVFHPVGTCKMGSDPYAVVDDQLRVHGIEGLRIADASVMPTLVSGNTNAPCIMIGEKAAAMTLAD
tara:strand:- start:218 stop:1159 length:942 start_codon:yes stop_codon:yes gene_type:complete